MLSPVLARRVLGLSALVLLIGCGTGVQMTQGVSQESTLSSKTLASRNVLADRRSAGPSNDADEADEPKGQAVPIDGTDLVRGRATVDIKAPLERVRETMLTFADYPEFMPHYTACRVLGRTPSGARDVYMEISALHGAVKMWTRVEVPKPQVIDGVETIETKFIEGNVKDFKAIWRFKRIDDGTTQTSLEVFLLPKLPMPTQLLNDENIDGAVKGVLAMRRRVEAAH